MSQEAELHLERARSTGQLLPELLDLAYGPDIAALVLLLGRVIGAATTAGFVHSLLIGDETFDRLEDPATFREIEAAIAVVMEVLRPIGEPIRAPVPEVGGVDIQGALERTAPAVALAILHNIAHADAEVPSEPAPPADARRERYRQRAWERALHERLSPRLFERMRTALQDREARALLDQESKIRALLERYGLPPTALQEREKT